ncbi:MAG: hypothetical protein ABIP38_07835 [Steroidobacteraceae bacterium]
MIVAARFVLLHLHKSGGSFANELVLRHVPGAYQVGYHLPYRLVPAAAARLPVLGFVRNPWSYYVSWFSFQQQRRQPNLLFRVLSSDGQLGFAATIENMLELGEREELLAALVAGLPQRYGSAGLNLPGPALGEIRASGLGFYSFLYRYMYGGASVAALTVGRMETLRADLLGLLENAGEEPTPQLRSDLLNAPLRNTSQHGAVDGYYDAQLRDRVARRDAALIEQFAYSIDR